MRTLIRFGCLLGLTLAAGCSWLMPQTGEPLTFEIRRIEVALQAPNPCWSIALLDVYQNQENLTAVSGLVPPADGTFCAQVITRISDYAYVEVPDLPLQHYIVGVAEEEANRFRPVTEASYRFIANEAKLEDLLVGKRQIFSRPSPPEEVEGAQ